MNDYTEWDVLDDLEPETFETADEILRRQGWLEESGSSETLSSLLTLRLSVLAYAENFYIPPSSRSSMIPPESWFVPDNKTVYVPRAYTPFYGYPLQNDDKNTHVVTRVGSGIQVQLEAFNDMLTNKHCWINRTAKVVHFNFENPLQVVMNCYVDKKGNILAPLHVFNSTAVREIESGDCNEVWRLMYSGISDSTRHNGAMGVLHDNTLVDVRPYEDGDAQTENLDTEKFDYKLRDECRHLEGFVDCVYTPTSLEAGKIRSFVHGVRIRLPTKTVLDHALNLISLTQFVEDEDMEDYNLPADLDWIEKTKDWTFHFAGVTSTIKNICVSRVVDAWRNIKGPERPSLHIFRKKRVLSLSVTPGCVLRPLSVLNPDPSTWEDQPWIDSMVFRDQSMMEIYGYNRPLSSEGLEFSKTFTHLVPYATLDEPPRPLLASSMSAQAICKPRVEMMSTVTPVNSVPPVLQTGLMEKINGELDDDSSMNIPGFPLLVAYINMKNNYEDSLIVSKKLNDLEVFSHVGYVAHPLPMKALNVAVGSKVGTKDQWYRLSDEGTVVARGESRSKTSYAIIKVESKKLRVGDKMATHHGQKFTICKILDESDMPTCIDKATGKTFKPHVIVAASSVHNRGTVGQIYESWRTFDHIRNYDFNPAQKLESVTIDSYESQVRPSEAFKCNFTYPASKKIVHRFSEKQNKLIKCTADYGIAHFWLLCHLARDKQHYLSEAPLGPGIGKGRLRGKPVRFGEMELLSLISMGLVHVASELLDSYDLVEVPICCRCRRLSILCDCDKKLKVNTMMITTRVALIKADICRAVYTINLQRSFENSNSDESFKGLDQAERTFGEQASSFKYE